MGFNYFSQRRLEAGVFLQIPQKPLPLGVKEIPGNCIELNHLIFHEIVK